MSEQDLIQEAFYLINAFKRHRALEQIERRKGGEYQYHQLKQYQTLDELELSLRAIQKAWREAAGEKGEVAAK